MPLPFFSKKSNINRNTVVALSEAGKQKATRMTMGGDYGSVLATLQSEEICTVSEISQRTGINEDKTIAIVRDLTPAFIQVKSTQDY